MKSMKVWKDKDNAWYKIYLEKHGMSTILIYFRTYFDDIPKHGKCKKKKT